MPDYIESFLEEAREICSRIDKVKVARMVSILVETRKGGGRLFILGVGGSAANASHAVNDFRKIAGLESYCPTDNVSELTARINDDGWDSAFVNWLKGSRLSSKDAVMVLSVGGGNEEKKISVNLVNAMRYSKECGAKIIGIVGRDGGFTAKAADAAVIIPPLNPETVTPQAEAFQGVVWHMIVTHPSLKFNDMKWESVK
jgi:D-sedoheptulose 7-phosphate isomerase